jgi:hypothetical protein
MLQQTLTVNLPESTVRKLKRAAELTYRSVDDVLNATINVALSAPPDVPDDLADELAAMNTFSDEALLAATSSSASLAQQRRLSQLSHAGGSRSLTPAEVTEMAQLLEAHDQAVLRRAKALSILALRGYRVPDQADQVNTENDNA